MQTEPHLQIFNPGHATSSTTFSLFPLLHEELRCLIWQHTFSHNRILKIKLQALQWKDSTNHGYSVVVDGYHAYSGLLWVNKEARNEALRFYRVHIPCEFNGTEVSEPGVLYFNPETDLLQIHSEYPTKETLVQFFHDLKRLHDPRQVGLLNLALDVNGLSGHDLHLLHPSDLEPDVNAAFVETLTQLEEVFFVSTPRAGRTVIGFFSGLTPVDTFFNRSLPIRSLEPSFERLHRDPRPIAEDLKKVYPGHDAEDMLETFYLNFLRKWKVLPRHIKYSFFLAFDPDLLMNVSDRQSAEHLVEKEDHQWNATEKWPPGSSPEKVREEDLSKAVRPAFGFWLFPIDDGYSFYREELTEGEHFAFHGKHIYDMSVQWPGLALSNLA